jgi:histidyl-tRNA synthetase
MFRYERPQKGRERMFTQFDVEALGSLDPRLDAEVILLAADFFEEFGLSNIEVRVNSMGDGDDRDRWREAVRAFLAPTIAERCDQCRERFERNVLRVLDCKNPRCKELNAGAPSILRFLSDENARHFECVQELLGAQHRKVVIDSGIVRGLDYYTRTVFEIHAPALGARSALCGGGRYDHLVRDLGGPDLGAVGFAIGFTATLVLLRDLGVLVEFVEPPAQVYVALAGEGDVERAVLEREAFAVAAMLRAAGVSCIYDVEGRSLKAQMKQAGKGGHRFAVVLGPEEAQRRTVQLKDLSTGDQREITRDALVDAIRTAEALPRKPAPA